MSKDEEIFLLKAQIVIKDEQLKRKDERILELERQVYGRRSEKQLPRYEQAVPTLFNPEQGEKVLSEEETDAKLVAITVEIKKQAQMRREAHRRTAASEPRTYRLPRNLERKTTVIEPPGVDLSQMIKIGEDVTERLHLVPSKFRVERIVRPVYKSRAEIDALSTKIHQAPPMRTILPGCFADGSLLSTLIIDKFLFHIPEHRQAARFKSLGCELSTSGINRWIHALADELYALYSVQMQQVLSTDYIQVDETTLPINDRPGSTRKGYVWAVRSVLKPGLFFHYEEGSRSQEIILKLLKEYQGALQTDGYAAYSIYEGKRGVLPLGCMAHVRRKFEHALTTDPQAQKALDYIQLLYTLEANLKAEGADAERIRGEREEKAWYILQQMEEWMQNVFPQCTPKSPLGKAISYAFGMWPRISRYCKDGRFDIDNNGIERSIRPWAIGRKNYLFSGNNKSAEDHCVFYSLLGSCKEAEVDPQEWLNQTLTLLRPEMKADELVALLPANFSKK